MKSYFLNGSWNANCMQCGRRFKAGELAKRWDGLYVCIQSCLESRHPQELIRLKPNTEKLPFTSPEVDNEIVPQCTGLTRQAVAGLGTAGCIIAGLDLGLRATLSEVDDFH